MLTSEEEAVKKTKKISETMFQKNDIDTNYETKLLSMYLPNSMELTEDSDNNIILSEDEEQTYILFYNSMEKRTSKLNYETAKSVEGHLLLESFEEDNQFGYVRVIPIKSDDQYELQIGLGGVKITTYTSKSNLSEDAEEMMKIANSIEYK